MPDDDPASRRLWRESLIVEPRPPATEAADGNEAWALLDHPSLYHDVVFVDVTMPHRGLHRLGRIRESPRLNGGRVVLGARSTDRETVNPPVQLGTLRGFVKPATAPWVRAQRPQIRADIAATPAPQATGVGAVTA